MHLVALSARESRRPRDARNAESPGSREQADLPGDRLRPEQDLSLTLTWISQRETIEVAITATPSGLIASPASRGLWPSTDCRCWVSRKI
jgi:hypothetical protein